MNERIRFHLDENVDPVIALALRRYGIDVTTSVDAGKGRIFVSSPSANVRGYIR